MACKGRCDRYAVKRTRPVYAIGVKRCGECGKYFRDYLRCPCCHLTLRANLRWKKHGKM